MKIESLRRAKRRWMAVSVLALAGVVALSGCSAGAPSASKTASQAPLEHMLLRLQFTASGSHGPFYLAKERGYYAAEGLDVDIEQGTGSQPAINDVVSGDAQVAVAASANVMLSVDQGIDIKAIATPNTVGSYGFFFPKNSPIQKVSQLAGKTIVSAAGTPQGALIPTLLKLNGVDPKSVQIINVAAASVVSVYGSGTGDATLTSTSLAPTVDKLRPSNTVLMSKAGINIPDISIVTTGADLKKNPELYRKFLRATMKGFQAAIKNPQAAVDAVAASVPTIDVAANVAQLKTYIPLMCPPGNKTVPFGENSPSLWASSVKVLTNAGVLTHPKAPTAYYSNALFTGKDSAAVFNCPLTSTKK